MCVCVWVCVWVWVWVWRGRDINTSVSHSLVRRAQLFHHT